MTTPDGPGLPPARLKLRDLVSRWALDHPGVAFRVEPELAAEVDAAAPEWPPGAWVASVVQLEFAAYGTPMSVVYRYPDGRLSVIPGGPVFGFRPHTMDAGPRCERCGSTDSAGNCHGWHPGVRPWPGEAA